MYFRNPDVWSGIIILFGMKVDGYLGGRMLGAKFGTFLGGPLDL